MGKSTPQSKGDGELLQRLQDLEEQILSHDNSQKKLRYISLVGICLITCLMLVFVYRLYDYVGNYDIEQVVEHIKQESPRLLQPELDALVYDLSTDIFPVFSSNLFAEFKQSMPELKEAGLNLSQNLEIEIRKRAEERLLESMIVSLENSSEEIRSVFPDFSSEVLEEQIGKSIDYYVERLHDSLEDRIAMVMSSLEDLKNTAGQISKAEGMEDLLPTNIGQAESEMLEAMLDLVVYEIKPEIGIELVGSR